MAYNYVHHSGRFDRSARSLVRGFRNDLDHGADVISFTEVDNESRAHALRRAARVAGWGFYRPGERTDECAVVWNAAKFELVEGFGRVLSSVKTYSTKGKLRSPFSATFVVLREIATGDFIVIAVTHTPSHVQHGGHWYNNNRSRQYRDGMKTARRIIRHLKRQYKPKGGIVFSLDANLDIKRHWVKAYFKATFPYLRVLVDARESSTHDNRTIDLVLVSVRVFRRGRIKVYTNRDSDHKTVLVRLGHN